MHGSFAPLRMTLLKMEVSLRGPHYDCVRGAVTHSRISASVNVWSGLLGARVDAVHDFIGAGMPRRSSQKWTFDFPLMGPMSMTCSSPNTWEGTPE